MSFKVKLGGRILGKFFLLLFRDLRLYTVHEKNEKIYCCFKKMPYFEIAKVFQKCQKTRVIHFNPTCTYTAGNNIKCTVNSQTETEN